MVFGELPSKTAERDMVEVFEPFEVRYSHAYNYQIKFRDTVKDYFYLQRSSKDQE